MEQDSDIVTAIPVLQKQLEAIEKDGKKSRHLLANKEQSKTNSCVLGKYVCEYCDRRFNEYSNLIKHRRIHTGLKPYKCELCGKAFTQSSNLNVHRKRCKGSSVKQTQFTTANQVRKGRNLNCKKKLITKGFQRNQNTVSLNVKKAKDELISIPAKKLALNKCISPKVVEHIKISNFSIRGQLQFEKRRWHENSSITKSENDSSKVSLNCTNLKVFSSRKVSVASVTATSLSQHSNENEINNKSIQEIGLNVSNFRDKQPTHTCEFCNRRFNESSNLIKHRRIHTGQRPYKCTFCGKDFTQSSNLNVHKRICKGQYFSRTSSCLDSSVKSARFSNPKSQNELTKLPKATRYLSSRTGAFENSSQLSCQDSLSTSTWANAMPSMDMFNTSSINGSMSQLYNIASFSPNENQVFPHKYIPFSSAQIKNICSEYAENNLDEGSSDGNPILIDPFQTKSDVSQNSENGIQPEENDPNSGSVNQFQCPHCNEAFQNSSLLQKHIQLHTGKSCFGTYNESANQTKQQMIHANNKSYICEFCQKIFTRSSTLNIHMQTCVKKFGHDTNTSFVSNEGNNYIQELTFNSQNPEDFDCQTVNTARTGSFDKNSPTINNVSHIDYIVIEDESEEDDNSDIRENIQQRVEKDSISSYSVCKTDDLKPAFIKDEPDSFPVSEPVSSQLIQSEVDTKSVLPEIEPFPSVLEVKQEPIQSDDPIYINVLNVKQEIPDEEYSWNQVCYQPSVPGSRLKNGIYDSETAPILESGFSSGELETNDHGSVRENENLFLENYESNCKLDSQNTSPLNIFKNAPNEKHLSPQSSVKKPFPKLQCPLPSCNGRTFKSASAFQVHIRVHNGQKPYVCEICKKNFNERSNYTKHLRIHSGYKPYKCTQCGRAFTQSSNLNVHKRKCRGLGTFRTTCSSISVGLLKPKTSKANGLNSGLSEYNLTLANASRNNANSTQHPGANIQNNVKFMHSSNCENITRYTCELCGQHFTESNDLIKHKIIHDIPKPYKCSFCHKAFTQLTNYNLHRATCRRKCNLIKIHDSSVMTNSEIKDTENSPENPNALLPSNSDFSIMPDINATSVESDSYPNNSSIYFSKRNELSLTPTENVQQGQNKEPMVVESFSPSLSVFDNDTRRKVILDQSDENSSKAFKSTSAEVEKPSQPVFLEKNKCRDIEVTNSSLPCDVQPERRNSSLTDTSNQINTNLSLIKKEKSKTVQTKITSKSNANPENVFQCKLHYCRKIFHFASELKEHVKQHRKRGVHVCKFCNKQFNESSNLIKHKRIHTGSKPYKCEFCNKFFSQSSNRNVHRKSCWKSVICNPAVNLDLQCDICLQQFTQISDLYAHKNSCKMKGREKSRNTIQKKSKFNSNFTGKFCKTSKSLVNIREQSIHFKKLNSLAHLSQGSSTNTFKSFPAQKHALNGHYMFQCPYSQCGKIFKMASVLRRHIKDHSEKQQYQCEFCCKKFNTSSNLSKHCRIHTGHKPYSCCLCGKLFTQSSNLNVHRKTCNSSTLSSSLNYTSLEKDLAGLDAQNQHGSTEKSHSASSLHITGIVENSYNISNDEQLLPIETHNQVINIDDETDDDNELNTIPPAEKVLSSTISLSQVESDIGAKSCKISSVPSPENTLRIEPTRLSVHSKASQLMDADVIMIEQSQEQNFQVGDTSQKELEVKSKPNKTLKRHLGDDSSNTLVDSVTVKNNSMSLFEATSQIDSGANSNNAYYNSSCSSNQEIKNTCNTSLKSVITLPIYKNNNLKPPIKMSLNNVGNSVTSEKFVLNVSKSRSVFSCKVRSCRKVFKSEQELRTHQCKRRTYPCEYCHKRFNESSNLIKHRRIHTGHKPYKCKFCGKTFTQSSNLNVHRKICAKKHSFVEYRFSQHLTHDRNREKSDHVNDDYLEINLSEDSISSVNKSEIAEASTCDVGDFFDQIEGTLSNCESHSPNIPSVSSLVIENSMTITKLEDSVSVKTKVHQDSNIIVENSLTGEVKLQISEKELNAFESKETLPNMTRMAENVLELENSQDVAQIGYSPNQIPIILKKEVDDGMDSNIIISQCNTEPLETLMMDDIYNSSQSVRALTPQLDLVPNSTAQLMHKSSSYARTMKTGVQLKKYTLTHLKRRTYACEYCKRRFNESSNLIKHRRIHTGLRPYKCQFCGRTFTQSSNRNVHKKICARKNQLSASVVQGHLSLSDNSLSGPKTNRATKCQKTDILQAHDSDNYCNSDLSLNLDHKTINTVTTSCYASMPSQDARNDNIESGSPVNDTEPICSISSVTSLRENPGSHLQFLEKKPECFDTNLVQDANPAIQCSRSGNSESHTSSSTDTNSQQLPFVGGVNSFNTDLSEGSTSISHFLNYDNPFSSNTEAAPSNPSHNFEQAFLMCQNQKQFSRKYFQCLFCPRLCKNSADFQRHMRVHTGYKPYKCKICSKLFTDYSNLSKHRRVHTGFKPYKCNLCFKAFSQSSNLNVHKKHCKGIQHNYLTSSMNLSLQSKEVTSSANQIKLNSQSSQVVPTYDLLRLKNSIVSTQSDHSSTSRFITESKLSEVKPQSGHLISKQTSVSSKSAAQRISLKYLNKMTSRWNKTFSKDSDASECKRFLNPDVLTSEKSTTAIPDAMTFSSTLNNIATPLSKNGSSLQMKNIGLLNKGHNVKVQSNSIIEKTNIYSCSLRNKKSNKQTQQKKHVGLRVRQKHYYCEYCNRKFNEASNLTKHRRIHTGHKPYKCQFCSKRFTQSSNLNVHKKICKSISQNPENPKDITQDLEDKNKDESENVSVFQTGSESQISEKSSKDKNLFISSCSTDMKLLVQHQKSQDSMQPKRSFENEDGQNNSVNLPAKISGLTNIAEVSKDCRELSSQKTDQVLLEHKEKNSEHSNQSHPKSSVYNEGSSQNSISSLSNEDIFISSPKHQKCDLLQENSIQNKQLDDLSCSNVMENESDLSARNLSSLKKTTFIYESDVKNDQNSLTKVGINNHSVDQKSEISEESSLCTSSSDQNRINNNGLSVEITAHSVSGNDAESAVVRQPPLMILSSQSYNIEKSDNDPGTTQLNIKQSLTNYNENLNKSISNDLPELSVLSQGKNCDHSNLHQSAVLNSGLSDSQSENKAQVHSNYESKFSSESALKHEDVFSCTGTDIELVQLQSQQPDMLKSIQSAINGILQTEGISSSGDQANQSLLQNAATDWFKIESGYHKTESADLNDIAPSNKNADSSLMVRSVDQINNLDDSDDVIIMDTSADFQSVKTKFNFVEEVQHSNKSSYLAVSQNTPVSNFNNTIEIQSLAKSESVNQLQSPSNTKNITDASLIDRLKTTGFLKSDSEKIISDYQSDVPSARAYNISDQPVMHNDQALLLQVSYPQQQFNSNRFVHDDDVAIIDVKSTLPVKVQNNSSITLSSLNYNPTYFSNSSNVSPAACKRDMDAFSDTITKQTDSRLDHIQESFDYLVPNITDQLLGNSDNKVVETSCQSKQQSISTSPSCVHVCEFCQERFLTPNLLVRHYCPNTGDKPYLCPDCGKAFTQYASVISHKSTCLKLSVKIADFPTLTNINVNKDDGQVGNTEKDIQAPTIDLIHWSGEYNFNSDTHTKMLVPVNQNDISIIQNSEPLSTANRKRIEESYEAKNNTRTSKFVNNNNNNQLSEFPSQNTEISLNDYDCIPGDHYNDFNSPISNSQNALGNKSHFLGNSYTNNDNSVVDISNILSSAESLPSNNIDSSFTSSTPVALDKLSATRLPPDNPNLQLHSNKPSLFSSDDFSYGHVNNYRPHNGISNNLDPNVLLKDLAADLSSNQANKYSLTTPSSSFSSSVHSNTSISASLSSSASSSSTSFINVLDSAVTIVCQYCDKILSLNEPTDHMCSGTTQANRYACSFCEKTLCDASSLSKHLRIHTGQKPYSCEFCGKAFTQSSNLNVHKRICKDKANTLQPT